MAEISANDRLQRIYAILSNDDAEDRACEAIPDSACSNVPRNYVLNVFNGALTKLAEQLAGPRLVLPWLLTAIGAPVFLAAMLMPLKHAASLLPQLAVSGQLRRFSMRKWFWVCAGLAQAGCLMLMIVAAWWLPPRYAGFAIVALLGLFSAASGTGSVAFQDVVGKTIGRGQRGEMLSRRSMLGGMLAVVFGIVLKFWVGSSNDLGLYLGMLLVAASLWALAALLFAAMAEQPGATEGGRTPLGEGRAGMQLWRTVSGYRRYIVARGLLLSIELAAPFFVLQAHHILGDKVGTLGLLIVSAALAQVLSSPFWGRFSDASSRHVLVAAGLLGAVAALFALVLPSLPPAWNNPYVFAVVFGLLGLAESGVRLGRKTFLIDAVSEQARPTHVAFANTIMGAVTLLAIVLGVFPQLLGPGSALGVLALLAFSGAIASLRMPEARDFADTASPGEAPS